MGIFSKPEVIILKESNAAKDHLDKLESLLPKANKDVKDAIQKEIAVTKAGIVGEDNIMFELKHSNMDMVVLHDINLETKSGLISCKTTISDRKSTRLNSSHRT